jgi:hypothetical protein
MILFIVKNVNGGVKKSVLTEIVVFAKTNLNIHYDYSQSIKVYG